MQSSKSHWNALRMIVSKYTVDTCWNHVLVVMMNVKKIFHLRSFLGKCFGAQMGIIQIVFCFHRYMPDIAMLDLHSASSRQIGSDGASCFSHTCLHLLSYSIAIKQRKLIILIFQFIPTQKLKMLCFYVHAVLLILFLCPRESNAIFWQRPWPQSYLGKILEANAWLKSQASLSF